MKRAAVCLALILLLAGCAPAADGTLPVGTLPQAGPAIEVTEPSSQIPVQTPDCAEVPPETTEPAESTAPEVPATEPETPEPSDTQTTAAEEPEPSGSDEPPETPSETDPAKPGLWAEVPTDSADWETRAVSDIIYTNADFGWSTYRSPVDFDGDGVEDQADILQGAKDYVATRPVYDAGYFAGGWAPEGRGVCTDVIAYALLAAGYNLQELVEADIARRPEAYPDDVGDRNIDFRRTRNLYPFFEGNFEKLTLDPYDYEAWQPGDIVLFMSPEYGLYPGHVAIVSDRRASDGLPYLIHHTDNDRYSYEQDFLTTPTRILVGHYRVGDLADSPLLAQKESD